MRRKMKLVRALVMIVFALFLTISCAKEVTQSQPAMTPRAEAPNPSDVPAEEAQPVIDEAPAPEVVEAVFLNKDIHFGFDSSALSDPAPQILTDMAGYLRINLGLMVTVQGHCDERGPDAYNIELGKKRAESAKNFLVSQGIRADRLKTISFGKSRPIATGQDEVSWAKNRRAQFVIN